MKPPAFDYIVATDRDMAVAALARADSEAKILAGGHRRKFNRLARASPNPALLVGGSLNNMLEEKNADQAVRILFLIGAAIMTAIAAYALWEPSINDASTRDRML